jgi:hypothetical protein
MYIIVHLVTDDPEVDNAMRVMLHSIGGYIKAKEGGSYITSMGGTEGHIYETPEEVDQLILDAISHKSLVERSA